MGTLYAAICELFEMYLLHTLRAFADMPIADIVSPTATATQARIIPRTSAARPCMPPEPRCPTPSRLQARSWGSHAADGCGRGAATPCRSACGSWRRAS